MSGHAVQQRVSRTLLAQRAARCAQGTANQLTQPPPGALRPAAPYGIGYERIPLTSAPGVDQPGEVVMSGAGWHGRLRVVLSQLEQVVPGCCGTEGEHRARTNIP